MARYLDRNPVPTVCPRVSPAPVAATTTSWSSEPAAPARRTPACWPGPATTWSWSTGPTRPATPARRTRFPAAVSSSSTAGDCSTTWSPPAPPSSGRSRSTTTGETVRHPVKDRAGVDFVVAPRRYVLDALLADAAVAAGAGLVTDTTVTGVLRDAGGRVSG